MPFFSIFFNLFVNNSVTHLIDDNRNILTQKSLFIFFNLIKKPDNNPKSNEEPVWDDYDLVAYSKLRIDFEYIVELLQGVMESFAMSLAVLARLWMVFTDIENDVLTSSQSSATGLPLPPREYSLSASLIASLYSFGA